MKLKQLITLFIFCSALAAPAHASDLYGFSEVDVGVFRGSRPTSEQDFQKLKDAGIKTILSLETSPVAYWLEKNRAIQNGFHFISEPISPILPYVNSKQIMRILGNLQDESLKPIYVHCRYGRDRTGLVIGMYRFHVEKWSREEAYREMIEFGFKPNLMWFFTWYFKTHTTRKYSPFSSLLLHEDDYSLPVQKPLRPNDPNTLA